MLAPRLVILIFSVPRCVRLARYTVACSSISSVTLRGLVLGKPCVRSGDRCPCRSRSAMGRKVCVRKRPVLNGRARIRTVIYHFSIFVRVLLSAWGTSFVRQLDAFNSGNLVDSWQCRDVEEGRAEVATTLLI